jgi:hypothetical protein
MQAGDICRPFRGAFCVTAYIGNAWLEEGGQGQE